MSLKIEITAAWYDLRLLHGDVELAMRAKGADIRYLQMREFPSDYADYTLRDDVNTEATSGLSGSTYVVADSTIYRKNEIITIYDSVGAVKCRARVTDKVDATHITVQVLPLSASDIVTLATGDKLFIKSDELLAEDVDGLICVDTIKYRHMFAVATVSVADNLLITITDSKKKL
jgi:hypothetical protein